MNLILIGCWFVEGEMVKFVGWRYGALIGGLIGVIGITLYPIGIDPYLHSDKWSKYLHHNK